jgi:hypothetical protein
MILLSLQAVNAPLMETYDRYASEKQIGGQLLLQTYKVNSIAGPFDKYIFFTSLHLTF